ncbi:MAG: autotransporter domain-containing protein [Micropepsaceae bacterium]
MANVKSVSGKAALSAFSTALIASASFVALGTTPAEAATCSATSQATYDACMASAAPGDTVLISGTSVVQDVTPTNAITIQVSSTGVLGDGAGTFGAGTSRLVIDAGGAASTLGVDTFASLSGAGTLTTPSLSAVVFGDGTNTAFSGTWVAPDLNTALVKQGAGALTINGMQAANGDFLEVTGSILQSAGTSNIKSIAVGTGTGNSASMTVSGGTLNFTGTGLVGFPCSSQCPALRIGDFAGTGLLTQTAGTIVIGAANVAGSMNIGNQGGSGTYTMSGGVLQLGVFGDVNSAGLYGIGRQETANPAFANSIGVFNVSGTALVDVQAGELINGDRVAGGAVGAITSSTVNQSGGTVRVRNGANLWLSGADNAGAVDSIYNLTGGTIEIGDGRLKDNYLPGATYQFNLGNGTIKVIDSALVTSVHATLTGATATTGVKIDTNGLGATLNGNIDGSGWLVKTGAGTLNLGGANTYTGGTAFNGGTVFVDAAADLGAASSGISFNGGTLQLGASFFLNLKPSIVMAGAGTVDTNGFSEQFFASISGSGTFTKTGAGVLFLSGSGATHTGAVNVSAGNLATNNANAIGDQSAVTVAAGAIFQIGAPGPFTETIGSLSGAGQTDIAFGSTLITGANNASTTYTGSLTGGGGVGNLTKVGTGKFSIGSTLYTGLTTVSAGELNQNGTLADSLLIAAGARYSGNATVSGNVTNNGAINPGNSPGTVAIVGNYVAGAGAVFNMEVQFNNAGAPVNGTTHDFVSIGGSATGATTLINVVPFAPSGGAAATTGNGVELVRVAGATGAGQFALSAPVFVGAYEYTLNYLPNYSAALDGYFLQSRLGEGLFADAAMFSASQALASSCFRGTDELVGDGSRSSVGRSWAKVTTGNRSTGADTGIDTDQDYTCGSGGIDLRVADNVRVGMSGGYGKTNVDVTTPAGLGKLDGDGGMIQGFMGYVHDNMFANLSVGYGNVNWTFSGPVGADKDAGTAGVIGSLQAGMLWPMGDWRLGAMAELDYDNMNCSGGCMLAGTVEDIASWSGKASLRLDGKIADGMLLPFVAVSFSDSLDGANTVRNGSASLTTETNSSIFNAKAGLTAMVGEETAVFINGGITEGMSNDVSGAEGSAGMKIFW